MYWDHVNGWGWTMMVLWSLMWVGFLGVIAWGAVEWITGGRRSSRTAAPAKTARDVLDERLALGEIDVDQYHERRAALEQRSRGEAS
jgi:putative membrane protein